MSFIGACVCGIETFVGGIVVFVNGKEEATAWPPKVEERSNTNAERSKENAIAGEYGVGGLPRWRLHRQRYEVDTPGEFQRGM